MQIRPLPFALTKKALGGRPLAQCPAGPSQREELARAGPPPRGPLCPRTPHCAAPGAVWLKQPGFRPLGLSGRRAGAGRGLRLVSIGEKWMFGAPLGSAASLGVGAPRPWGSCALGLRKQPRCHLPIAKPGAWGQSFPNTFKAVTHMNSIKARLGLPRALPVQLYPSSHCSVP